METLNTAGVVGWCLSPEDLAISKLLAGREKDFDFVRVMLKASLVMAERLTAIASELDDPWRTLFETRIVSFHV